MSHWSAGLGVCHYSLRASFCLSFKGSSGELPDEVSIKSDGLLYNDKELDTIYLNTKDMRYNKYNEYLYKSINDSNTNPLLRTYKRFKTKLGCEPYLLIPLQPKYRQIIARTRSSSHNLGIELRRHTRPKVTLINERICIYCSNIIFTFN